MLTVSPVLAGSQARAEQAYERALQQIERKEYSSALATLRKLQKSHPDFRKMASVQTRIAVLQESSDAGESLVSFLSALASRDAGDMDTALRELGRIASADPAGSLTDDALYITAYLQVMDRYDFKAARVALQLLEKRFPDSAYSDSATYLDAIALEQLGETLAARDRLRALRHRHTSLDLPLNFRWPRGSLVSRYWFDRADRRLAIVEERLASASRLDSRERQADGRLRVAVNVQGMDMQLILVPSPLTEKTRWFDGRLGSQLPPPVGIFDGQVDGVSDSWVRVVLENNTIRGVINMGGQQYRLHPSNLIGTLDYYQPRSRKPAGAMPGGHSELADMVQGLDALVAPPVVNVNPQGRARGVQTDIRAVPLSIVVDSQYDRYYAGGGMAIALNNLNIADGVYRQFGLALSLDEALTFDTQSDPMQLGPVTLETLLRSFRDYRLQYKTLFEDSALTYLFTGNPRTDVTLGLAWIDTTCRLDGYDVGVTTPSTFGDILLAHELGHSLGAQHDTDTVCNDDSRSLMWPNISEHTHVEFTSCSKASILQSRSRSCLENSVDLGLAAYSSGSSVDFQITNPDGALTIDARLIVETSTPGQLDWPDGCVVQAPTSAVCFLQSLEPMEQRTLVFPASSSVDADDAPVTAQLVPVGLLELNASDNLATASPSGADWEGLYPGILDSASLDGDLLDGQSDEPPSAARAGGGSVWYCSLLLLLSCLAQRLFMALRSGRVPSKTVSS